MNEKCQNIPDKYRKTSEADWECFYEEKVRSEESEDLSAKRSEISFLADLYLDAIFYPLYPEDENQFKAENGIEFTNEVLGRINDVAKQYVTHILCGHNKNWNQEEAKEQLLKARHLP